MNTPVINSKWLALLAVAACVAGAFNSEDSSALGTHPATPCACEAEGNCQPQGPWGYTQTQWRRWPGDTIERPTQIEEEEKEFRGTLDGSELPVPEKEGLRGPEPHERRPRRRPRAGDAEATEPADGLDAPVPAAEPAVEEPADEGFGIPGLPGADQPALAPDEQPGIDPVQPGGVLEQPVEEQPQPAEEAGDELFDPFGQNGPSLEFEAESRRRTTQAPQRRQGNGPPPLPSSLKKFSRNMRLPATTYTRARQHSKPHSVTMALAR